MDKKTKQMIEGGFRRGILKTSVANVERIMSRATDSRGKVHYGEAGKQLLRRQQEAQAYHERNK